MSQDRDDRYPDVPAFVDALTGSLAGRADGSPTWLPVDPDLTQPGAAARTSASGAVGDDFTAQAVR